MQELWVTRQRPKHNVLCLQFTGTQDRLSLFLVISLAESEKGIRCESGTAPQR
jgi:hypothetical protein